MRFFTCFLALSVIMAPSAMNAALAATHKHTHHTAKGAGARGVHSGAVILSPRPGTYLDSEARKLNAEDIANSRKHGENPLVLVGSGTLSSKPNETALFVQLQSAGLCGSAGCSTSVYLRRNNQWVKVLDSVSGPVTILKTRHAGMQDLLVGDSDRWIWSKNAYHDTLAAPQLNLKRSVERFRNSKKRRPVHKKPAPKKVAPAPEVPQLRT